MSKLIALREKLNLTQEELSHQSGISVRTIQRIEAGTTPKGYTLKALAKALDIHENEMFEESEVQGEENIPWIKLINLSSFVTTLLPPANIVLPFILALVKKKFTPLTRQLLSIQILWTIIAVVIYILSAFMKVWFALGDKFVLWVLILLVLTNCFIILRNAVYLNKKKTLYFGSDSTFYKLQLNCRGFVGLLSPPCHGK